MLTVQERTNRQRPMPRPPVADENRENDDAIETGLLILLGECEFRREGMLAATDAKQLPKVLDLADELMKEVVAYTGAHLVFSASLELKAAATKAQEFHAFQSQLRNRDKLTPERELASKCLLSLQEAVMLYFSVFTRRFSSSYAARTWVDVAATFVVDMKMVPDRLCRMLVHA